MARLTALPSLEIIRGLKGIIDFYLWKGLPCARAWPHRPHTHRTEAEIASALLFGAVVKAYSKLAPLALEAYREAANDQPRTARDIMVSGVYGKLHEASMSDFLDLLTQCRDFLANLQALLTALDSIDTDQLVVNVDQSVLPPLAATTINQGAMITALQKLDDLQDALQSKHLDRLIVRGQDQLFSVLEPYRQRISFTATGTYHDLGATPVPPGQLWLATTAALVNTANDSGPAWLQVKTPAISILLTSQPATIKNQSLNWSGWNVLGEGEFLSAYFSELAVGDTLRAYFHGFKMTLET